MDAIGIVLLSGAGIFALISVALALTRTKDRQSDTERRIRCLENRMTKVEKTIQGPPR